MVLQAKTFTIEFPPSPTRASAKITSGKCAARNLPGASHVTTKCHCGGCGKEAKKLRRTSGQSPYLEFRFDVF